MKVLHLISGGDVGGAKTHVLSLLHGLGKTEQVRLVCFREGEFAEDARKLGIDTCVMEVSVGAAIGRLTQMIREEGFQIIHCHGARANLTGAILRRKVRVPIVTTVHSDYRLDYLGRPLHRLTYGTINTIALRMFDYHIGVSDAMAQLLISRGFDPQTMFAIYNGIDFTPVTPKLGREDYLRSVGLEVQDDTVVFGIAARLDPVKDMPTLIRGFSIAVKDHPNIRLLIAGEGEQRQMLEALAAQTCPPGTVVFAGWVTDMDSFYHALDVNTLTSISETFPYAITEGARMRCATIASNVGGIPYIIEHGVTGLLFEPQNAEALGAYMTRLAESRAMREQLGENLYEKASHEFSIDATVGKQIEIYQTILRRTAQPKKKKSGVLICGAYGKGNAGDDAILEAILQEMRSIDPDMPITVLTKDPKATRLTYRVRTVGRMDVGTWKKAMRHAGLYINGGGSLIQDVTSRRSLWFYLHNIQAAHKAGCKVQMYGCGIGPVLREQHRKLAASVLNASVDVITLREPDSLKELQSMGVTKPEILLTADPALTLPAASEDEIDSVLLRAGIPTHGKYLCFALRNWKGFEDKAPLFAQAAKYAYETYGLTPVFAAVEKHLDPVAGRLAAAGLDIPHYFLDDAGSAGTIIGALSRMQAVVSMRLHALIFAAGQGIPLAGVVYDPKVSAFLRYIGQENFLDLDALTADALKAMIDRMVSSPISPEEQAAAVQKLRQIEQVNVDTARRLLGK